MRHLFLVIFIFMGFGLQAQSLDTTEVVNISQSYKYEKIGNFHYFSVTTTNPDSSQTISISRPYTTKKQVLDIAQAQINASNDLIQKINEELKQKSDYFKMIQEQQVKFEEQIANEIAKTRNEIINLRTNRKLIQESREGLKAVK
jgi:hypothetical protein